MGFDDASRGKGRVDCRVFADGKEVYANPDLRADAPPVKLSLPVSGTEILRLHVDYGRGQDTGDRVIWANARLGSAAGSGNQGLGGGGRRPRRAGRRRAGQRSLETNNPRKFNHRYVHEQVYPSIACSIDRCACGRGGRRAGDRRQDRVADRGLRMVGMGRKSRPADDQCFAHLQQRHAGRRGNEPAEGRREGGCVALPGFADFGRAVLWRGQRATSTSISK